MLPPTWAKPRGYQSPRFLPHTREGGGEPYYIRDANSRSKEIARQQNSSKVEPENFLNPYISHVRRVSRNWPYMQYLEEFLDTTCAPPKQRYVEDADPSERFSRMHIASLEFNGAGDVDCEEFSTLDELRSALDATKTRQRKGSSPKLFIAEDISRDVIEAFGSCLSIDPRFFRGHIGNYHWFNIRDPWVQLPDLELVSAKRNYMHIRYLQPRYFLNEEPEAAVKELGTFNVLRRLDIGDERAPTLDEEGSSVGLVRSKTSFWVRSDPENEFQIVGVILLDPTVKSGLPLWAGFGNLHEENDFEPGKAYIEPLPPTTPIFEQLIYWASHMTHEDIRCIDEDPRMFMKCALHMICGHWKTVTEYVRTRLIQTEWEIEDPSAFGVQRQDLDLCVRRLQRWRRMLPSYYEFVTAIDSHVLERRNRHFPCSKLQDLKPDIRKILEDIESLQLRAERAVSLAANMVSIEEAKKGSQQNQSLKRLTYLACVFIPLQFVSGLFSMANDLSALNHTFRIYFATSIPLTVLCLFVVVLLSGQMHALPKLWRRKQA